MTSYTFIQLYIFIKRQCIGQTLTFLSGLIPANVIFKKMNHLSEDSYLQFNPETLVEVRKSCGFNKVEDLNKAIDIFEEWVKQQNHFIKKDFSKYNFFFQI